MRWIAAVLGSVVLMSGCAGAGAMRSGEAVDGAGAATPAMELVGAWEGTAFAVPGSNYFVSTPVELTIKPDGTWRWSQRGREQAIGTVRYRGDSVVLDEHISTNAEQRIELQRRGDTLWGLSGAFIPGAPSAVELRKVRS
jgi:hypothetical protein